MIKLLKQILMKARCYEHIRFSGLFSIYATLFKRIDKQQYQKELNFYKSFLKNCNLIFDIGANDGHKTKIFLELASNVVSVEPEHKNYKTLLIRFRNFRNRVIIEKKAVADKKALCNMYLHHPGSAFNTLSTKFKSIGETKGKQLFNEAIQYQLITKIETLTLDDLINMYGIPYFIKIDTEGYELNILNGLTKKIAFISAEFLLPEFKDELIQSLNVIESKFGKSLRYNIAINEQLYFKDFQTRTLIENLSMNIKMPIELLIFNPQYLD